MILGGRGWGRQGKGISISTMQKVAILRKCVNTLSLVVVPWLFVISRFHCKWFHCKCFDNITGIDMYAVLTKHEVKMAVYWPGSFMYLLRTETKSKFYMNAKQRWKKERK